jgi:acyl transferase domain-containing protein
LENAAMSAAPPSPRPVAVIGMACRYAGVSSVAEFWHVLREGIDATSETPQSRYDADALYSAVPRPGKVISRRAGYVRDIDQFDAPFFGLSADEAGALDPQQRLLMTTAWEAVEDAGVPARHIAGSRTGVYVGSSYTDYPDMRLRSGLDAIGIPDLYNVRSMLAGRLSYVFDLHGPSICLDTACSSSLVAVHLACQSLRAGETVTALAAGVSLKLVPDRDVLFSQARVLATDGRCKFADAAADGAAFSDGVGVVVLKPLDQALADGDRVRAVILGSAVSNDGASGGSPLTASLEGHVEMLRWAYQDAGVDPADVDFVEAHGNGTPTMDPIEFAGLAEVLGQGRSSGRPCLIGSVKTNIGHPESAAGIAALIKTVLCLEHGQVVPSLHFHTPNPDIAWADIPLVVPTAVTPLPEHGRPAIAGISGQGLSCVNAHIVVGQAEPSSGSPRPHAAAGRPHLLALSARTRAALDDLALAYIRYLEPGGPGHHLELRDVCYSAAVRRQHHPCRLAITASTRPMVISKLRSFLARSGCPAPVAAGEPAPPQPDLAGSTPPIARMERLASAYMAGEPVDWAAITEPHARFVPLPTYPWQNGSYWLGGCSGTAESGGQRA